MSMNGAELLVRSLTGNGITHAFNVPGFGIHPLMEALRKHRNEIRYITGPSETAIGLMADGYGRIMRRPAFVNVYHASGTALAMLGVTTAWADRSPMVFTTTTSARSQARRDQYASVPADITDVTRQFTKWSWEVPSASRIPEAIARAVIMATTPPMGPVHLAFPMDIYEEAVSDEIIESTSMARPERLKLFPKTRPDAEGVAAAASLLTRAARPLIIAGADAAQYGAVDRLVAIAEALGAAVLSEPYVPFMGFPNTHRLFGGRFGPNNTLVQRADVILVVGAEFTGGRPMSELPPSETPVIFMTTDPLDVGKQIWADIALIGHPAAALADLYDAIALRPRSDDRTAWREEVRQATEAYSRRLAETVQADLDLTPVSMPRMIREVEAAFGSDTIIVDHSTTGTAYLLQVAGFDDPSRYFGISARASAQGWGLSAAIGMQIAQPERRVVVFLGDGGFMFTSSTLYTAAMWRTPIVALVLKNGGWNDVAYSARKSRGWSESDVAQFGWVADPVIDHAGFATSLGIKGLRARTPEELRTALAEAVRTKGPVLIEVEAHPKIVEYYISWLTR